MGISIESSDGKNARVSVGGDITETTVIPDFAASLRQIDFDLSQLRRFNSAGVQVWVLMIRGLVSRGAEVRYEEAPDAFTNQCVMIDNFLAGGIIKSMRLSFFCLNCEGTAQKLVSREKDFPDGELRELEPPACPECGGELEMDTVLDGVSF